MNIGDASRASGVSAKLIRHYEAIGVVPPPSRRASNYRDYDRQDVHRLGFVGRARALGFSMDQIRLLLRLWQDQGRASQEVKALTVAHIAELNDKIALLMEMRATLEGLAAACDGDHRPECPIIDALDGRLAHLDHHAGHHHSHHNHHRDEELAKQ